MKGSRWVANYGIGFFVLLIIAGCTPAAVSPTVVVTRTTPTAIPTATSTPVFSDPVVSPTVTPETAEAMAATAPPTPTVAPEPTDVVTAVCPEGSTSPVLAPFTNTEQLRTTVLGYLNSGGDFLNLVEQLTTETEDILNDRVDMAVQSYGAEADVDGDGVAEAILTVDFTNWEPYGEHVAIWILRCAAGVYQIVFEDIEAEPLFHVWFPVLPVNLDQDPALEIILEWSLDTTAGGWTAQIIEWVEGSPVTHWLEWPMPDELFAGWVDLKFEDLDGDGIQEIITAGHTPVHLTGGHTRDMVRIYEFDGYNWRIASTEYLPSNFRHQVLADGQRAFDAGNLELAAQFFDQSAHDDTLISSDSKWDVTQEIQPFQDFPDEYQKAFALFRLMIVQIALGDQSEAENSFNELSERYPSGSRGGEFTQLAALYRAEVESGKSFGQACAAVTQFTLDTFPYLEDHIGVWGMYNMAFTNETHCPYKAE